jgi:dTDP-4-dehydrorhamnose reductase
VRIAVTGKVGQVASGPLERGAAAGHEVIALGRPELDLVDPASAVRALEAAVPDAVVLAAAYTSVDKAESESALAHAVNARGAGAVAEAAKTLDVPLRRSQVRWCDEGRLD